MTDLEQAIFLRQAGEHDQARALLLDLIERDSANPAVWYQCAWVHDVMEREREAVLFYRKALELGIAGEDREGAYLGLGSTYRTLGMYADAGAVLEQAMREYPENREFLVFYAMVLHNRKEHDKAMEIVLRQLAETSGDKGIQSYKQAILFYSDKLVEIWE
ncbi:tetratricopeptide repeat protein [Cohnella thailandensis]|uniref:Tetratricopeptide repeat protein n=1 Tax=Cohnella thailandensis TaxID=557557 RepID=A0A841T6R0_9BACL|nr:tetratricopeptide repeat protein [Cohnella thailandensis]MBB6638395.1 tetratricopeptide repeat protein [Cohnella thailandensis]MBP1977127.1 tetratricopeptide (TPR) repeat protein [Cohnella thailandensis]